MEEDCDYRLYQSAYSINSEESTSQSSLLSQEYLDEFIGFLSNKDPPIRLCTINKHSTDPIIQYGHRLRGLVDNLSYFEQNLCETKTTAFRLYYAGKGDRHNAAMKLLQGRKINRNFKKKKVKTEVLKQYTLRKLINKMNRKPIITSTFFINYWLDTITGIVSGTKKPYASNISIQMSLKDNTDSNGTPKTKPKSYKAKEHYWDIKITVDEVKFNECSNMAQLRVFLFCFDLFKILETESNHDIKKNTWSFFYQIHYETIEVIDGFTYFFLDHKGNEKQLDNCKAHHFTLYIKVDPQQIEPRLKEYIIWGENKEIINLSEEYDVIDGDRYGKCKVYVDVDEFEYDFQHWEKDWASKLKICAEIADKYVDLQHYLNDCRCRARVNFIKDQKGGVMDIDKFRSKGWAGSAAYGYGTNNNEERDPIHGIRPLNPKVFIKSKYHEIQSKNVQQLSSDEDSEDIETYGMDCTNLYIGPGKSGINNHDEYAKFCKNLYCCIYGEESSLTIGAKFRASSDCLFTIPTHSLCMYKYSMAGLTMRIDKHHVNGIHLPWEEYNWRIADLYRVIQPDKYKLMRKHMENCDWREDNQLVCECFNPPSFRQLKKESRRLSKLLLVDLK